MGILDSCLFGSSDNATDPALSSVVIDDGEGGGGGGGNSASKDLLSASLAQSGILDDAVGDGVVSLVGNDHNDYPLQDMRLQVQCSPLMWSTDIYRLSIGSIFCWSQTASVILGYDPVIGSAGSYGPFLVDKTVDLITGLHCISKRFLKHYRAGRPIIR